jgi:NAD(P)-dependent dehydrogenase (short-subunit alcohol dehydrogenase family)
MPKSEHRVAIVTGAGAGIGRACAERLALDGLHVVAVDLNEAAAVETVASLKRNGAPEPMSARADVSDRARAHEIVAQVLEKYGRIDALVNNAGLPNRDSILDITEESFDRTLSVHLKGSFIWSQAVARTMIDGQFGRIVCMSSVSAKVGVLPRSRVRTAYAAAKAGMLGLVRGLAVELAPHITVNAICPGRIMTGMTADGLIGNPESDAILAAIPAGRLGQPEDIAHTVSFFLSEGASYITGEVIDVNGGLYID